MSAETPIFFLLKEQKNETMRTMQPLTGCRILRNCKEPFRGSRSCQFEFSLSFMRQQTSSILLQPPCHAILHRHQLLMSYPADIATRGWRCTLAESKPAVVSVHPDDHLPKPKWICLWQRFFLFFY